LFAPRGRLAYNAGMALERPLTVDEALLVARLRKHLARAQADAARLDRLLGQAETLPALIAIATAADTLTVLMAESGAVARRLRHTRTHPAP
jgi:hypothetical protein